MTDKKEKKSDRESKLDALKKHETAFLALNLFSKGSKEDIDLGYHAMRAYFKACGLGSDDMDFLDIAKQNGYISQITQAYGEKYLIARQEASIAEFIWNYAVGERKCEIPGELNASIDKVGNLSLTDLNDKSKKGDKDAQKVLKIYEVLTAQIIEAHVYPDIYAARAREVGKVNLEKIAKEA